MSRVTKRSTGLRAAAIAMVACLATLPAPPSAHGFCGFYVDKGDAKLFNNSSQVVLVRERLIASSASIPAVAGWSFSMLVLSRSRGSEAARTTLRIAAAPRMARE